MDTTVKMAAYMAEVGIPPTDALERLSNIRDRQNAEGLFRETFVWVEQFATIEPDGLWQASARDRKTLAITEAAKRGYFVLAREQIDQFPPDHGWPKAEIVAELARAEAQQAGVL